MFDIRRDRLRAERHLGAQRNWQIPSHVLLGAAALFSGFALVAHILSGIALPLALGETVAFAVLIAALIWTRLPASGRTQIRLAATVGLAAGLIATASYDGARFVLSRWDRSPYNPFETVRIFGILLLGSDAASAAHYIAGAAFHVMNGVTFGVGYTLLLGRRGIVSGVAWGLGLELLQLSMYPGWLGIQLVREFAQISAASHLVYGATLGACARYGLAAVMKGRGYRAGR